MKVRTEISDSEEIVIRHKAENDKAGAIKELVESALREGDTLTLCIDNVDYFIPKSEILFFESGNGKVYAHTKDAIYSAPYKLFELENMLPSSFIRISKSAIVNVLRISSMRRELVGNGELTFRDCGKTVYFSRAYYKLLQYKINEMRFTK